MRILQISNSFKPAWEAGGTTRVVYDISCGLKSRGHDVTVYTTDRGQKRVEIQKNKPVHLDNLIVYYFSNISNYIAMKLNIVTPYYLFFIARKHVKDFDIIHIHEHRTFLAVIVSYFAKKNNIPYIVQAHGFVMPFYQKTWFKKIFDKLWGNNVLNNASNLFALTETESEQYKKMGIKGDKITIIPNGIDLNEFQDLPKKGEFRKKYDIKTDEKIILYLGRIHKTKGIELLIKSFSTILIQNKNVKLVITGPDDGFLDNLKNCTKTLNLDEKVVFTGPLYGNQKTEVYNDADIFVTPSFSGFPITFLESCFHGVPIITTNKGDELDWMNNNVGFVVKYDENELSTVILKILSDVNLRSKFGQNGKNLIRTKFNWQIITEHIEKVYENIR